MLSFKMLKTLQIPEFVLRWMRVGPSGVAIRINKAKTTSDSIILSKF